MQTDKKKNIGVTKSSAEILIKELIERAKLGNELPKKEMPFRVLKLEVFGSFLTDKEKLGDIDILFEMECKYLNSDSEMNKMFSDYTNKNVRAPISSLNAWPFSIMFLRNKKKSYSFHGMSDIENIENEIGEKVNRVVIFKADSLGGKRIIYR